MTMSLSDLSTFSISLVCPKPVEIMITWNSIIDIKEGKHAGCKTVGVLSGYNSKVQLKKEKPDFIINNIMDLKFN